MQYSCVAFILLSPLVILSFISIFHIDYQKWELMEEPDIGEPLIYHFIGLLSTNRCLRIDEFIFFDIKLSDSAKHIGLYLYKYPSLERWFGALCA